MPTDMTSALPEVLEKLERATPGIVEVVARERDASLYVRIGKTENGYAHAQGDIHLSREDAEAMAAAVNFLREHGPALLAGDGWLPIESAPGPGVVHVRGLWVRTTHEGHDDEWDFCTYTGWVGEFGDFVDTEHGETFGWEADDYEYWMPLPAQPIIDAAMTPPAGSD